MKNKPLPKTQQRVIDTIKSYGFIQRYPGGYWNGPTKDYKENFSTTKAINECIAKGLIFVSAYRQNAGGKFPVECKKLAEK